MTKRTLVIATAFAASDTTAFLASIYPARSLPFPDPPPSEASGVRVRRHPVPRSPFDARSSCILRSSPDDGEDEGDGEVAGELEEGEFYRDLQKAKSDRLGAFLPESEIRAAAEPSERDFLAAMRAATEEFRAVKAERGSDGAVDFFVRRINEEEEEERNKEEEEEDDGEWS